MKIMKHIIFSIFISYFILFNQKISIAEDVIKQKKIETPIELSIRSDNDGNIFAKLFIVNNSTYPFYLSRLLTGFEYGVINDDVFKVVSHDGPVFFKGRRHYTIKDKSFILPPGGFIRSEILLNNFYQIGTDKDYCISYDFETMTKRRGHDIGHRFFSNEIKFRLQLSNGREIKSYHDPLLEEIRNKEFSQKQKEEFQKKMDISNCGTEK